MDTDMINTILIVIGIIVCIIAIFMIPINKKPRFIDIDYSFNIRNKILTHEKIITFNSEFYTPSDIALTSKNKDLKNGINEIYDLAIRNDYIITECCDGMYILHRD